MGFYGGWSSRGGPYAGYRVRGGGCGRRSSPGWAPGGGDGKPETWVDYCFYGTAAACCVIGFLVFGIYAMINLDANDWIFNIGMWVIAGLIGAIAGLIAGIPIAFVVVPIVGIIGFARKQKTEQVAAPTVIDDDDDW